MKEGERRRGGGVGLWSDSLTSTGKRGLEYLPSLDRPTCRELFCFLPA